MKIIKLYTGEDQKSHFLEMDSGPSTQQSLGSYSATFPVVGLIFRDFKAGEFFDWHNAPQPQYIVYLEGEIEVEASGGEKRIFRQGDILFATDETGAGHTTRSLSGGRSLILTSSPH